MGSGPSDRGPPHPARFGSPRTASYIFTIAGKFLGPNGSALVGARCMLFEVATGAKLLETTTDATGLYTFNPATNAGFFFVVAFSSDGTIAGCTLPNLVAR